MREPGLRLMETDGGALITVQLRSNCGPIAVQLRSDCARFPPQIRRLLMESPLLYAVEAVALGALGVVGAQQGINAALPPPVCVALGVTICAGGLVRDVLCKRDVALGSETFAFATGAGAAVYVACRKVAECGISIPISARVTLAMAITVGLRAYAWQVKSQTGSDSALAPMGG